MTATSSRRPSAHLLAQPAAMGYLVGSGVTRYGRHEGRASLDLMSMVDMKEGFRVMGHGEAGLPLGASVLCAMREIAGRPLPFFRKDLRVP